MEKNEDNKRESVLILGKIYREVNVGDLYIKCLRKEFSYSFKFDYKLLPWIIDKPVILTCIMNCLELVYDKIVAPMSNNIKEIMKKFTVINEAELFCSSMEFRVEDSSI